MKDCVVYILSNSAATIYIGVTGNIDGRIFQHDARHDPKSFVSRYNLHRLVFMETYPTARQAIDRENSSRVDPAPRSSNLFASKIPSGAIFLSITPLRLSSHFSEADPSTSSG